MAIIFCATPKYMILFLKKWPKMALWDILGHKKKIEDENLNIPSIFMIMAIKT